MSETRIFFDPFCLDLSDEILWNGADKIPLRPKTFSVLRHLLNNPGCLVPREDLLSAVWPEAKPQTKETALKGCVLEIREALKDDAKEPRFIETAHRRGYRFIGRVNQAVERGLAETTPGPALLEPGAARKETANPASGTWSMLAKFPQPPGAPYNSEAYVHREEEEAQALNWLRNTRSPVVLHGPPSIGVATLLSHLLQVCGDASQFNTLPAQIVRIKFLPTTEPEMQTYDDFLQNIGQAIADQLGGHIGDVALTDRWKGPDGPGGKLTQYLGHVILPRIDWLIVAMEGIDVLHDRPYLDDFCALLRSWVQKTTKEWPRLRLLLTISTLPPLLEGLDRSPLMNVSKTIQIKEFTTHQIYSLAELYRLRLSTEDINLIIYFTGGHPYLAHLAVFEAAIQGAPIKAILEQSLQEGGVFENWLLRQRSWMHANELFEIVCDMAENLRSPLNFRDYCKLFGKGLVVTELPGLYRLRYRLYQNYFMQFRSNKSC